MAAAVADEYMETAMDNDDVFPCKGCGEILEEGKAFELGKSSARTNCPLSQALHPVIVRSILYFVEHRMSLNHPPFTD
jgi:hypothetical protein